MVEIRNKAVQIDAATRLLQNMQAVASMQAGDDNQMAQTLSRLSQGKLRIQPVQPAGTYNVYYNGQMVYEGVTKEALMASLRTQFDQQYQAQVAELRKTQDAMAMEDYKGRISERGEITKQRADMYKMVNVEMTKARLKPDEYNFSTVGDYVYAIPKQGGPAKVYTMVPELGVDGQPRQNADGTPVMQMKEYGTTNSVPTQ
jgi:flagellin-specific chaperone FliS